MKRSVRKTFVSVVVLVGMMAVFAGGNSSGTAASGSKLGPAVRDVLAANAGHAPGYRMVSGGMQAAIDDAYRKINTKGVNMKPAFPPTQNSNGCSNTYSAPGRPDNIRANQDCSLRRQAEVTIVHNFIGGGKNILIGQNDSRLGYNRQGVDYSFDTGGHWGDFQPPTTQTNKMPSHGGGCTGAGDQWTFDAVSDPALAFDGDGAAYFSAVSFDFINDGFTNIFVTKSNPGLKGTFFHTPDSSFGSLQEYLDCPYGIPHDNFDDPLFSDDKEFIAADNWASSPYRGNVYVTWTIFDFHCGGGGFYCASPIFFSRSTDGGATWSSPLEISGNSSVCNLGDLFDPSRDPHDCDFSQGSDPLVGPDGTIYVAFNNANTTKHCAKGQSAVCQQLFVKSTNGGTTWSDPVRVAFDFAREPVNGLDGALGNGCPLFRQCLPPNGYRVSDFPSISIDSSTGKLAVFWDDMRNGDTGDCAASAGCNTDVFMSISNDGGANWNATQQVDPNTTAQYYPWGGVDSDGNLYVMYYDRKYGSCESTGCLDVTLASSSNDGASWTRQRITTSSMPNLTDVTNPVQQGFIGDYNGLDIAAGNVIITWSDTRGLNGTIEEDAYFAKVPRL
jgi:hypothetical protein